ncbi:hypothetical protein DENSPDRAFT_780682 [Dentipellis sp. KUC8613]|nr:hypothetical protein DENSPDRAFT_780682 [Dentipellis sp. KUC8613]
MEEVRGPNRGSYIHGRSVHNIRIERLWVDVTSGFGSKWKDFFHSLELFHRLDVNLDSHIWLLQFLFLEAVNQDAQAWMGAWNNHVLRRRGQPSLTPVQLYTHGTVLHGRRSIFAPVSAEDPGDMDEADQPNYGIDWADLHRQDIIEHHERENSQAEGPGVAQNPFTSHVPDHLSYVHVPEADCPLTEYHVDQLQAYVSSLPQIRQIDMHSKTQVWDLALNYCTNLWRP